MLEIKNFRKEFGSLVAVNDLSFTINKGEILGLLGANGAGKSTTFRSIMNLIKPTDGQITFNGEKIDLSLGDNIGYMCEQRALITKYTVERQLKLFASLKGVDKSKISQLITEWLEFFKMEDLRKKTIKDLSKGNQQKIQLISAIMHKPKLIILDEPFSGLDPFNIQLFKKVILQLKNEGSTIIFSSHRLDHVEYFCENIIVLVEGNDIIRGNIDELKLQSKVCKVLLDTSCPLEKLQKLDYVKEVENNNEKLVVFLKSSTYVEDLFDVIKEYRCRNFSLVLPTLEEVFLEMVGENYES